MLNQFAVGNPSLQVNLCIRTSSSSWWNAKPFCRNAEGAEKVRQAFGTHMENREPFLQIQLRSQHLIRRNWIHGVPEKQNRFTHQKPWRARDKHQFNIRDVCLDGQSKRLSSSVRETLLRTTGQTNNDCRFLDVHFDKFPTPVTFLYWRTKFKTEVCSCSKFPTEAVQWIKDVEIVGSVGDLKSSSSIRGIPNAELWSTRCEDYFSTGKNHPYFSLRMKNHSGRT